MKATAAVSIQLLSKQPSVNNNWLSHHVGGILRTKPNDCIGYLLGLTEASYWDTRSNAVHLFTVVLSRLLDHWRVDDTWTDSVEPDSILSIVNRCPPS
jgi:hypothetical protein